MKYDVLFDAGREARKKLNGCKFGISSSSNCQTDIKAEIMLSGDEIGLNIYELSNFIFIQN